MDAKHQMRDRAVSADVAAAIALGEPLSDDLQTVTREQLIAAIRRAHGYTPIVRATARIGADCLCEFCISTE